MTITVYKHSIGAMLFAIIVTSCSLSELVKVNDPETESILDRDFVRSPQGAVGLFYSSLGLLQRATSIRNLDIGLFTDELTIRPWGTSEHNSNIGANSDPRYPQIQSAQSAKKYNVEGILSPVYNMLQNVRVNAIQSRWFLKKLNDPSFNSEIAGSFAVEGYALVMLAEDMCSGIPLSDMRTEGEMVYSGPLTTDELFRVAIAKFDSALQISHDSTKYITLARIGKGRALMGIGEYNRAAEAVSGIEKGDKFEFKYADIVPVGTISFSYWTWTPSSPTGASTYRSTEIVNQEGVNGMTWYVDPQKVDPRLPVTTEVIGNQIKFTPVVRQRKYVGGVLSFPLAKWSEAKMIEAESYLKDSDERWIESINEARVSMGIPDTSSPQDFDEKVNLLFRERSYWFYGEGVRLADYRRLVRQYNRDPYSVYPTGGYSRITLRTHYGTAYVYVPHINEYINNHKYEGCFNDNP